jgi:hypothetical protein
MVPLHNKHGSSAQQTIGIICGAAEQGALAAAAAAGRAAVGVVLRDISELVERYC